MRHGGRGQFAYQNNQRGKTDMTGTVATIREVLCEITKEDVGPIDIGTSLESDLDLDSMMFVQFLIALEERFPGLEFNQETLTDLSFRTVGSLVEHIDALALVAAE